MDQIHRHMAQPLCHNRCCTTRSGAAVQGFPVAQTLGLRDDGITRSRTPLKWFSDSSPMHPVSAKLLTFSSYLAQPGCVFTIGKTLRGTESDMDLPVRTWVLLVGWPGGWLAEQTARSAQRLSTYHGPTGFTIMLPNPHASLESAGDRRAGRPWDLASLARKTPWQRCQA
jgi:hypothetical protein